MARYLSQCIWLFAAFLAPSAAASTLASAAAEAAQLMPPPPPKAGEDMASQLALHSAGRRLTANQQNVSDVAGLGAALADSTVDHIYLRPYTYLLSTQLEITRSVKMEANPGTAVLRGTLQVSAPARASLLRGARLLATYPGSHEVLHMAPMGPAPMGSAPMAVRACVVRTQQPLLPPVGGECAHPPC
eukprot:6951120-Prymnesium_polylepis.1